MSLEVPLKVHGSKVTEAVRGSAPRTEPFEEETSSMIVFPHGGVLRMSTPVNTGQMLVLTNLKSRQDAICRVAKVRSYSSSSSYVEVEFTHRQPGFWGVYFESDAVAAATPAAPAAPSAETSRKSPGQTASGPASQKNSGRDTNESTFIAIGSQEEVQPAASSTSAPSLAKPRTAGQDSRSFQKPAAIPPANIAAPLPVERIPSAQSPAPKSQQEEEDASLASETPGESAAGGSNAAAASRGLRSLSGEAFGAHLESTTQTQQASPEGKKNGLLIAACVAVLLLAGAGAVLFLYHRPTNSTAAVAVPVQTATPPEPGSTSCYTTTGYSRACYLQAEYHASCRKPSDAASPGKNSEGKRRHYRITRRVCAYRSGARGKESRPQHFGGVEFAPSCITTAEGRDRGAQR